MNIPTDTYKEINMFRLFLRTYFYNQNQEIIEAQLREKLPSVASISWDPYNYEYKIKCSMSDYRKDFNHPIMSALVDSFSEGGLNPKFIKDNTSEETQRDIILNMYYQLSLGEGCATYLPMLYKYMILSNSKMICLLL